MVKLTNKEILERVPVLAELRSRKLPIKVSYAIAKNISKIEKELKFYNDGRSKIISEYCLRKQDGSLKITDGKYDIDPKRIESFNKEIDELQEIEVEIDIHKFNIALLENIEMTPDELIKIDFMIEE
ncbi:hypothetical protein KLF44_04545 [Clostridium perfringens]|uniref:hypothetical protein n=1 Tax=Clostridium perfringens TaxID=1502 RepID=UPI001CCC7086|nr:hypothetical protein [Clostridium perfringens]UBK38687.1 hypothetical protein KLF44_04545 [Clostridium perfringens]UBK95523.1 hypothetical protein KLF49_04540 [Clostridium perfringens]